MFKDLGNSSLLFGVAFLVVSLCGGIATYFALKKESMDKEKLNTLVELGKWFIGSVALVLSTSIINDGFKEREQDVSEIEVFDKYTQIVTKSKGIEETWLLCEYFVTVSPEGVLLNSWLKYRTVIEPRYREYINNESKIRAISIKDSLTTTDQSQLLALQQKNEALDHGLAGKGMLKDYIIIAGSGRTLAEAQKQTKKVDQSKFQSSIYKNRNRFRTVVGPFSSYEQALEALKDIKISVHRDAYVVEINTWCSNSNFNGQYYDCKASK